MLKGNIFQREVEILNEEIPENLFVGRLVCQVYESFRSAAKALEENSIQTESAFFLKTDTEDGKVEFEQAWRQSIRQKDSVLVLENKTLADSLTGLVFYTTEIRPYDFFYQIKTGDILDYQIPAGRFCLDLTPEIYENRRQGKDGVLVKPTAFSGISIVHDEYARFYFIKGNSIDHLMIDTGFGKTELKALQRKFAPGSWQVALTHGHKDHSGGCNQFSKIYGSKVDLEASGICYLGQTQDLRAGQVFRIGHRRISVLDLSGHSNEDYAFYVEPEKILICGDAIAAGPNYTMCRGSDLNHWIASLERLQQSCKPYGNMEIKELWCSHRKGKLENPVEAIQNMKEGLIALREGRGERYGATVYGYGAVKWMRYGECSYFYKE